MLLTNKLSDLAVNGLISVYAIDSLALRGDMTVTIVADGILYT
jgi:hypothetical protein